MNVVVVVKMLFVSSAVMKLKSVLVVKVVLRNVPTVIGEVTKKNRFVSKKTVRVLVVETVVVIVSDVVVVVTLTLSSVEMNVEVVISSDVVVAVDAIGIVTVVNSVTISSS